MKGPTHHSSGSLQYYLVIIALEIAIICLLQYGDANVSPNHAYFAHNLTSFELGHYGCMCKLISALSAATLILP